MGFWGFGVLGSPKPQNPEIWKFFILINYNSLLKLRRHIILIKLLLIQKSCGCYSRPITSQYPLSHRPMPLAGLRVLLVRIRHLDGLAIQILAVHALYGGVWCLEVIVWHEAKVLRLACLLVAHELRREDDAEGWKHFFESSLVRIVRQISDEYVCANFLGSLVLAGLVDFDVLAEQFDHVHDFDRVVGILLRLELHKAVALVFVCDFISRKVHVCDRATLEKELPEQLFRAAWVEWAHIDCCIRVSILIWALWPQTIVCYLRPREGRLIYWLILMHILSWHYIYKILIKKLILII